jgi:hypothetical protein
LHQILVLDPYLNFQVFDNKKLEKTWGGRWDCHLHFASMANPVGLTSSKKFFLPAAKSSLFFLAYKSRLLTQEKTNPLLSERTF